MNQKNVTEQTNVKGKTNTAKEDANSRLERETKKLLVTIRGPKAQAWFNAVQRGAGTLNPVFEENDNGVITHVNIYLEA